MKGTSSANILDPQEIKTVEAQASVLMKEGIRLTQSGNDADALLYFDRARELRRRLPTEVPIHAYGLAACWLNRAEALTRLGPDQHPLALRAYDEGLAPFWAEYLIPYWKDPNPTNEAKTRQLLTLETTKFQYTQGFRNPENVSPDSYTFDQMTLDRPGNDRIQLALFYDYRKNPPLYPSWHAYLRDKQPPVLAVWGKNDPIFLPAGAEAFLRDVPRTELHLLNTGHFALEEDGAQIAQYILDFLGKNVK